jgi:Fe-S cluster assembly protein SufD
MTTTAMLLERLAPAGPTDETSARARSWLDTHGLPDARDEAWRYTPVNEIVSSLETATPATPRPLHRSVVDDLAGHHGGPRLVFVNGIYAPELSDRDRLPAGLWCGPIADLPPARAALAGSSSDDELVDGFQALNRAAGRDAAVVLADPGAEVPHPIHVVHIAAPGDRFAVSHPHTIIGAGDGSRLHVIETFTGLPGATLTNASTTIHIGVGATLAHHRIQTEAADAIHVGHTRVDQATGSQLRATSLMFGADIARDAIEVSLHGPDARTDLDGLYLPTGRQRHDTAITVDHAASRCTSTQQFKGVVDDHARGSFSGRIIVRPDTVATDAQQSNRNLLLSATAQADIRPWLEIFADDVRCTHGATVGRLDDDALFYLRSRGIPLEEGRSMLIDAFVREITDAITPASLRDHVTAALAAPDPETRS